MLGKVFGASRKEVAEDWGRFRNELFRVLYPPPSVIRLLKSHGGRDGQDIWHVWEIRDLSTSFWSGQLKNETVWRIVLKWTLQMAGWAPRLPAPGPTLNSFSTCTLSLGRE